MEPATLSRRERNKENTRAAIHEAALSLAEEKGLAAVTVEAISERADVAPRTFSNYFAGKEDAVLGLDPNLALDLAEALAARPAEEDPLTALSVVLIESVVNRIKPEASSATSLRRIRLVSQEPHLKARMAGHFDQLTAGLVKVMAQRMELDPERDPYPSLLVNAYTSAVRSSMVWWSSQTNPPPLDAVMDWTFRQLAEGLAHPHPCPSPRKKRS